MKPGGLGEGESVELTPLPALEKPTFKKPSLIRVKENF